MVDFEPGFYYIRNVASGKYIGRLLTEDDSLSPKQIVNLPHRFAGQIRFLFERTGKDEYKITNNGGRLIAIDLRLFAALLPEPYPEQRWNLVQDGRTGEDTFAITDPDKSGVERGWKDANQEDYAQVHVGIIPVGRAIPPFYPHDAVWILEKAED